MRESRLLVILTFLSVLSSVFLSVTPVEGVELGSSRKQAPPPVISNASASSDVVLEWYYPSFEYLRTSADAISYEIEYQVPGDSDWISIGNVSGLEFNKETFGVTEIAMQGVKGEVITDGYFYLSLRSLAAGAENSLSNTLSVRLGYDVTAEDIENAINSIPIMSSFGVVRVINVISKESNVVSWHVYFPRGTELYPELRLFNQSFPDVVVNGHTVPVATVYVQDVQRNDNVVCTASRPPVSDSTSTSSFVDQCVHRIVGLLPSTPYSFRIRAHFNDEVVTSNGGFSTAGQFFPYSEYSSPVSVVTRTVADKSSFKHLLPPKVLNVRLNEAIDDREPKSASILQSLIAAGMDSVMVPSILFDFSVDIPLIDVQLWISSLSNGGIGSTNSLAEVRALDLTTLRSLVRPLIHLDVRYSTTNRDSYERCSYTVVSALLPTISQMEDGAHLRVLGEASCPGRSNASSLYACIQGAAGLKMDPSLLSKTLECREVLETLSVPPTLPRLSSPPRIVKSDISYDSVKLTVDAPAFRWHGSRALRTLGFNVYLKLLGPTGQGWQLVSPHSGGVGGPFVVSDADCEGSPSLSPVSTSILSNLKWNVPKDSSVSSDAETHLNVAQNGNLFDFPSVIVPQPPLTPALRCVYSLSLSQLSPQQQYMVAVELVEVIGTSSSRSDFQSDPLNSASAVLATRAGASHALTAPRFATRRVLPSEGSEILPNPNSQVRFNQRDPSESMRVGSALQRMLDILPRHAFTPFLPSELVSRQKGSFSSTIPAQGLLWNPQLAPARIAPARGSVPRWLQCLQGGGGPAIGARALQPSFDVVLRTCAAAVALGAAPAADPRCAGYNAFQLSVPNTASARGPSSRGADGAIVVEFIPSPQSANSQNSADSSLTIIYVSEGTSTVSTTLGSCTQTGSLSSPGASVGSTAPASVNGLLTLEQGVHRVERLRVTDIADEVGPDATLLLSLGSFGSLGSRDSFVPSSSTDEVVGTLRVRLWGGGGGCGRRATHREMAYLSGSLQRSVDGFGEPIDPLEAGFSGFDASLWGPDDSAEGVIPAGSSGDGAPQADSCSRGGDGAFVEVALPVFRSSHTSTTTTTLISAPLVLLVGRGGRSAPLFHGRTVPDGIAHGGWPGGGTGGVRSGGGGGLSALFPWPSSIPLPTRNASLGLDWRTRVLDALERGGTSPIAVAGGGGGGGASAFYEPGADALPPFLRSSSLSLSSQPQFNQEDQARGLLERLYRSSIASDAPHLPLLEDEDEEEVPLAPEEVCALQAAGLAAAAGKQQADRALSACQDAIRSLHGAQNRTLAMPSLAAALAAFLPPEVASFARGMRARTRGLSANIISSSNHLDSNSQWNPFGRKFRIGTGGLTGTPVHSFADSQAAIGRPSSTAATSSSSLTTAPSGTFLLGGGAPSVTSFKNPTSSSESVEGAARMRGGGGGGGLLGGGSGGQLLFAGGGGAGLSFVDIRFLPHFSFSSTSSNFGASQLSTLAGPTSRRLLRTLLGSRVVFFSAAPLVASLPHPSPLLRLPPLSNPNSNSNTVRFSKIPGVIWVSIRDQFLFPKLQGWIPGSSGNQPLIDFVPASTYSFSFAPVDQEILSLFFLRSSEVSTPPEPFGPSSAERVDESLVDSLDFSPVSALVEPSLGESLLLSDEQAGQFAFALPHPGRCGFLRYSPLLPSDLRASFTNKVELVSSSLLICDSRTSRGRYFFHEDHVGVKVQHVLARSEALATARRLQKSSSLSLHSPYSTPEGAAFAVLPVGSSVSSSLLLLGGLPGHVDCSAGAVTGACVSHAPVRGGPGVPQPLSLATMSLLPFLDSSSSSTHLLSAKSVQSVFRNLTFHPPMVPTVDEDLVPADQESFTLPPWEPEVPPATVHNLLALAATPDQFDPLGGLPGVETAAGLPAWLARPAARSGAFLASLRGFTVLFGGRLEGGAGALSTGLQPPPLALNASSSPRKTTLPLHGFVSGSERQGGPFLQDVWLLDAGVDDSRRALAAFFVPVPRASSDPSSSSSDERLSDLEVGISDFSGGGALHQNEAEADFAEMFAAEEAFDAREERLGELGSPSFLQRGESQSLRPSERTLSLPRNSAISASIFLAQKDLPANTRETVPLRPRSHLSPHDLNQDSSSEFEEEPLETTTIDEHTCIADIHVWVDLRHPCAADVALDLVYRPTGSFGSERLARGRVGQAAAEAVHVRLFRGSDRFRDGCSADDVYFAHRLFESDVHNESLLSFEHDATEFRDFLAKNGGASSAMEAIRALPAARFLTVFSDGAPRSVDSCCEVAESADFSSTWWGASGDENHVAGNTGGTGVQQSILLAAELDASDIWSGDDPSFSENEEFLFYTDLDSLPRPNNASINSIVDNTRRTPLRGLFRPSAPLSQLRGRSMLGRLTLIARDTRTNSFSGKLLRWGFSVETAPCGLALGQHTHNTGFPSSASDNSFSNANAAKGWIRQYPLRFSQTQFDDVRGALDDTNAFRALRPLLVPPARHSAASAVVGSTGFLWGGVGERGVLHDMWSVRVSIGATDSDRTLPAVRWMPLRATVARPALMPVSMVTAGNFHRLSLIVYGDTENILDSPDSAFSGKPNFHESRWASGLSQASWFGHSGALLASPLGPLEISVPSVGELIVSVFDVSKSSWTRLGSVVDPRAEILPGASFAVIPIPSDGVENVENPFPSRTFGFLSNSLNIEGFSEFQLNQHFKNGFALVSVGGKHQYTGNSAPGAFIVEVKSAPELGFSSDSSSESFGSWMVRRRHDYCQSAKGFFESRCGRDVRLEADLLAEVYFNETSLNSGLDGVFSFNGSYCTPEDIIFSAWCLNFS